MPLPIDQVLPSKAMRTHVQKELNHVGRKAIYDTGRRRGLGGGHERTLHWLQIADMESGMNPPRPRKPKTDCHGINNLGHWEGPHKTAASLREATREADLLRRSRPVAHGDRWLLELVSGWPKVQVELRSGGAEGGPASRYRDSGR